MGCQRVAGWLPLLLALFWLLPAPLAAQEQESMGHLVVFTTDFCPYCQNFKRDIAPAYPKTAVGRALPLVIEDLHFPERFETLARTVRMVPTMVVVDHQGREWGRLYGYRNDEFFWAELEAIWHRMGAAAPPGQGTEP